MLVHSVRGQSRATCALAAYIMRKYNWSLLKSLEFLNSRRPDLEIRATFIHQLSAYEARLQEQAGCAITSKWDELSNPNPTFACEELLLRNTFINSQMGPLPLPGSDQTSKEERRLAIKWIDDGKDDKEKLKTNKSHEDLIIKAEVPAQLKKVDNHRQKDNHPKKSTIKPFKLCNNKLTGIDNFTEISKNPLTLPEYYGLAQENSEVLPAKVPVSDEQKKNHKARRPDDKIDRESKSLRRQNDRNLERRQRPAEEAKPDAPAKMNEMFYKKESDRQIFSGTESEFEEIAEVKPNKKVLKITESDFENDIVVKDKSRGGSKKPNFGSNNS